MRLVLIDKQNRVRGDTANLGVRSFAWAYASTCGKVDVADLATVAARLLDAKLGHAGRGYSFSTFTSNGDSDGYFVFDCGRKADRTPPTLAEGAGPEATAAVMTACFYVGYVRRDH
jgi:hypothetical protein